jgi:hypothetical protein
MKTSTPPSETGPRPRRALEKGLDSSASDEQAAAAASLVGRLDTTNPEEFRECVEQLKVLGEPAITALIQALTDPDGPSYWRCLQRCVIWRRQPQKRCGRRQRAAIQRSAAPRSTS